MRRCYNIWRVIPADPCGIYMLQSPGGQMLQKNPSKNYIDFKTPLIHQMHIKTYA